MSVVATDLAGSQKGDLKWAPVWRAKCKEFVRKNNGFQVSVVATDLAGSQKMDLKWALVWRAKCKEFVRTMRDFRCQWWRRIWRVRRKWI